VPPAGYMTRAAVEACLVWLSNTYPAFTELITLPNASADPANRFTSRVLRIRAGEGERNGALLVGGTHARELINPDLLAGLALKLCWAYDNNTGLTFGPKSWSATDIRVVVEAMDIFILPLLNPDGREYVQLGNTWWRKNRGVNADGTRGTDLNRNYDFLWQWAIGNTSTVSSSDVYRGDSVFSEPETRNVRWLLDMYPEITCFADVHSFSELILYPWGDDNNQSSAPSQNFLNTAWDGLRGAGGAGYAEYIPAADQTRFVDRGIKVRDAIAAVRGRTYTVEQSFDLYGTSGVSADFAYSRFFRPGRKRKIWAYVIETNYAAGGDAQYGFQPPYADALKVIEEVQSGLIQFMLGCVCVVREVGRPRLSPEVLDVLRRFRDDEMAATARGRRWAGVLETHGDEVLGLLADDRQARAAAERLLDRAAEVVLGADAAEPPQIDRDLATQVDRLAARLEKSASPGLRRALAGLRKDAPKTAGKTARGAIR
jgi:carboxypeptidase T